MEKCEEERVKTAIIEREPYFRAWPLVFPSFMLKNWINWKLRHSFCDPNSFDNDGNLGPRRGGRKRRLAARMKNGDRLFDIKSPQTWFNFVFQVFLHPPKAQHGHVSRRMSSGLQSEISTDVLSCMFELGVFRSNSCLFIRFHAFPSFFATESGVQDILSQLYQFHLITYPIWYRFSWFRQEYSRAQASQRFSCQHKSPKIFLFWPPELRFR